MEAACDVLIIGASASGLMCAIEAGKRGRKVIVLDHANKAGKKILMSGGGRCNFTNYTIEPENYISHNPHFCKSALSRFTQWDFIQMVERHKIPYHERDHGQLFCNDSARDILNMLLDECRNHDIEICLNTHIDQVSKADNNGFFLATHRGEKYKTYHGESLVVASGGLSIPKMCASPIGYQIAEQFGIKLWPTRAGLVPFTLQPADKEKYSTLSGIAIDSLVSNQRISFRENILFTHRGISGPAILQISSYWHSGEIVTINLLPNLDLYATLHKAREENGKQHLKTFLSQYLPKRVITVFIDEILADSPLHSISDLQLQQIQHSLQEWRLKPNGTEGYRTAEITLGGVDCDAISSKTMEANNVKGLFFIGEVLDITGWLGGYNFQWAWSSGWCAGQYA